MCCDISLKLRLYAVHLKLSISSHNTDDTNTTTSQPTTTYNTERTNHFLQLTLETPVRLMVESSSVVFSDYESAQRTRFLHSRRQRSTGRRLFNIQVFPKIRQVNLGRSRLKLITGVLAIEPDCRTQPCPAPPCVPIIAVASTTPLLLTHSRQQRRTNHDSHWGCCVHICNKFGLPRR